MSKWMLVLAASITACFVSVQAAEFAVDVQHFKLDNGMTFLVVTRSTAPVFSGFICAEVGSAYEKTGNIGSAHLLEHMMFKGSETVGTSNYAAEAVLMAQEDSIWALIEQANCEEPYIRANNPENLPVLQEKIATLQAALDSVTQLSSAYVIQNEFDRVYTANGAADFNATTGYDVTSYFVSLPANRLELWFNMESDRLKHLALREFFPERAVVIEERRLSVENSAEVKLFEQLIGTAFIAHPYQIFWEWPEETGALTRSDLRDFFHTYYIPQRLTAVIVGDVSLDEVKRLANQYFGDIPAGRQPEPIHTREPIQTGERRVEVEYEANPELYIGYHATAFDDPDEPAFRVMQSILADGRTSRLYKSLVLDKQLCLDVAYEVFPGAPLGDKYAPLFCLYAVPKDGITSDEVEAALYEETDRLSREPVSEHELQKIKNRLRAEEIWSAYSNLGLAMQLGSAQNLAHDYHYAERLLERMGQVTPEDIMAVASKYLTRENRTVAVLIPVSEGGEL
ncbi:MAG TPA: pitrilysin family protein [candidate division Zixibacteria bacterium]|nr:pitrilysin family protein [candidate division Zixibacteria bacterium]